jgi:hypothetical protein
MSLGSSLSLMRKMAPKEVLEVPDPLLATPALEDRDLCYSYAIASSEMGVLTFEPYKSLILPFWAFRTVPIAQNSADVLWAIFVSYCERGDFVVRSRIISDFVSCFGFRFFLLF